MANANEDDYNVVDSRDKKNTYAEAPFSHTDYGEFQQELRNRRDKLEDLLKTTLGGEEGPRWIYNEVGEHFERRADGMTNCINALNKDITELDNQLEIPDLKDAEKFRTQTLERENKLMFLRLVKDEQDKEEDYRTLAMKRLLLLLANNCIYDESAELERPDGKSEA